ncbi:helix-turn-helix domain-containing protein [Lysinibacillus xylanilyticus]|uniref:helix-turn-helix domain-containing protein n=1 Tax=Lysinibacillus xylanilyticus TaxID=582475 RepID=UPI002B248615|nr:helix-turn-helix transcriptional regulator [Lysinibacillus xylanilyticus]MEB2282598.1 helix-turn-helix domain-containing protein [Lysinibacillus xylanilyticus]
MKDIQIGRLIRKLRKDKSLNMIDFAAAVDISQPALSRIESGQQEIAISTLKRICHLCDITISEFFIMLENEVDIELIASSRNDKHHSEEKLEKELLEIVNQLNYEQKKGLYVLLLPYIK